MPVVINDLLYVIQNAVDRHLAAPTTFEIPPLEDRLGILPPQYVKLIFTPVGHSDPIPERMWVQVMSVQRRQGVVVYTGCLDNDPANFPEDVLKCGDKVKFGPEHIIDILADE